MPSGAFHGGHRHTSTVQPVVFDTGQILFGFAAGVREFGERYLSSLTLASEWLVNSQDKDGAWRLPNPFAVPGDHSWETHVAWGLLESAKITGSDCYANAGMKNIRWAANLQTRNGWFPNCGLGRRDADSPLTHSIGYTLRGIIEGYLFSREAFLLDVSLKSAISLLQVQRPNGSLPGQLDHNWNPTVQWTCLTGCAQIALCWLILYNETGKTEFLEAAKQANAFVRRTLITNGPPSIRGAVKGSFPFSGAYCPFQFPNWACKFMIDSSSLELALSDKSISALSDFKFGW